MFLNPENNPPEEQRLPVLTGFLVVLLIAIWGLCSMLDKGTVDNAHQYYQSSVLAKLEVPIYQQQHPQETMTVAQLSKQQWLKIQTDADFVNALDRNQLITPSFREYPEWKDARERHAQLLAKVVSWEYGFTSSRPSVVSSISHQFLHPGWLLLLVKCCFFSVVWIDARRVARKIYNRDSNLTLRHIIDMVGRIFAGFKSFTLHRF